MAGADHDGAGRERAEPADGLVASLLGLRDELAAAASLVVALAMACRGLDVGRAERGALLELGSTARDRLDAVLTTFDSLITRQRDR